MQYSLRSNTLAQKSQCKFIGFSLNMQPNISVLIGII